MKFAGTIALSAGAAALAGQSTFGEVVYEQPYRQSFGQQNGNNAAYYGDDVHLGSARTIETVTLPLSFFSYDPATYTPDLRVDLFNVTSAGIPIDSDTNDTASYTPIATVHHSDITFTGSNYNDGGGNPNIYGVTQYIPFDFSSFNLTLQDFAFAFRDDNPAGTAAPGNGFSMFFGFGGPTTGSSINGFLTAYPNDLQHTTFTNDPNYGGAVAASITAVPEPASLGLLGLGTLFAARRRKSAM